jgi:hypothetical protein
VRIPVTSQVLLAAAAVAAMAAVVLVGNSRTGAVRPTPVAFPAYPASVTGRVVLREHIRGGAHVVVHTEATAGGVLHSYVACAAPADDQSAAVSWSVRNGRLLYDGTTGPWTCSGINSSTVKQRIGPAPHGLTLEISAPSYVLFTALITVS